MSQMMSCGCAAQGKTPEGKPVCLVHDGAKPVTSPSLEGRKAICSYGCKDSICESRAGLAFFRHEPTKEMDTYYCGCFGWD